MEKMLKRMKKFLTDSGYRFRCLASHGFYNYMSDEKYLKRKFKLTFGYNLNLDNPQTFNEKLQWLKLYDRNPLYTTLADKYEAKQYVAHKIGKQYVVPLYGVWDKFNNIDFDKLPNQFVLKTTHDSGGSIICKDKRTFNISKAYKKIRGSFRRKFYYIGREWPYRDIIPKIIAEKFLDDNSGHELTDYKFWCFHGQPKVVYCTNKSADIYENFYDMDFKPLSISHGFRRQFPEFEKPKSFEKMKELARILSNGYCFVRIDFFNVNQQIYFSEFTFYDWAGFKPFTDLQWDKTIGAWIEVPIYKGGSDCE